MRDLRGTPEVDEPSNCEVVVDLDQRRREKLYPGITQSMQLHPSWVEQESNDG